MYAALWRILPGPAWVRVLILLVLAAGETGKDDAAAAKRLLRSAGAKLLGCVLNKTVLRSRGYYTYEPAPAAD